MGNLGIKKSLLPGVNFIAFVLGEIKPTHQNYFFLVKAGIFGQMDQILFYFFIE